MGRVFGYEVFNFIPIVFVVVFFSTSLSIVDRIVSVFKKRSAIGDSLDVSEGHRIFNLFFQRFDCLKDEVVRHLAPVQQLSDSSVAKEYQTQPDFVASKENLNIQLGLNC